MVDFEYKYNKQYVYLVILIFVMIFLCYYPRVPQVSDEVEYLRNTYLLTKNITSYTDPLMAYNYVEHNGKYISRYPLSSSIAILPFYNNHALFLFNLIALLLGTYYFIKLLDKEQLDKRYAIFYLLYLPFVLHSTTLMMDLWSTTLTLIAIYYYLETKTALSGIVIATSILLKPTNIIQLIIIGLFLLYKSYQKNNYYPIIKYALGAIIPIIAFIYQNYKLYGNPLSTGYAYLQATNQFILTPTNITYNIIAYTLFLILLYPGMLFAGTLKKHVLQKETIALTLTIILFSSITENSVYTTFNIQTILFAFRYVFPIIPLLLLGYIKTIDDFLIEANSFIILSTIALLTLTFLLLGAKNASSQTHEDVIKTIYQQTQNNSLILGMSNAHYISEQYGNRSYLSVYRPIGIKENPITIAEQRRKQYPHTYVLLMTNEIYGNKTDQLQANKYLMSLVKTDNCKHYVSKKSFLFYSTGREYFICPV